MGNKKLLKLFDRELFFYIEYKNPEKIWMSIVRNGGVIPIFSELYLKDITLKNTEYTPYERDAKRFRSYSSVNVFFIMNKLDFNEWSIRYHGYL